MPSSSCIAWFGWHYSNSLEIRITKSHVCWCTVLLEHLFTKGLEFSWHFIYELDLIIFIYLKIKLEKIASVCLLWERHFVDKQFFFNFNIQWLPHYGLRGQCCTVLMQGTPGNYDENVAIRVVLSGVAGGSARACGRQIDDVK